MALRLIALEDGPDILVDRLPVIVGRHPRCDVRLESLGVSRSHCRLTRMDDEILVSDLGSTNGIWIDGQRVESGWLRPGGVLSIGKNRFRVEPAD